MWQIIIQEPTPSRNAFYHKHWRVEHTAKKRWTKQFAPHSLVIPPAHAKRLVMIERYGMRKLDVDNFFGGLKVVLDSLKSCGLIVDDDDKNMELLAYQRKLEPKQRPYTVITLDDVHV